MSAATDLADALAHVVGYEHGNWGAVEYLPEDERAIVRRAALELRRLDALIAAIDELLTPWRAGEGSVRAGVDILWGLVDLLHPAEADR